MSRKESITSIKSKQAIKEALKRLLIKKKDINNISITEISKESGLSRTTFYRHYETIEDVLKDMEKNSYISMNTCWERALHTSNVTVNFLKLLTEELKKHDESIKKVATLIPFNLFDEAKKKINWAMNDYYSKLYQKDATSEKITHAQIIAGGIASLYIDYFQGHSELTLDQICGHSISLINKIV